MLRECKRLLRSWGPGELRRKRELDDHIAVVDEIFIEFGKLLELFVKAWHHPVRDSINFFQTHLNVTCPEGEKTPEKTLERCGVHISRLRQKNDSPTVSTCS